MRSEPSSTVLPQRNAPASSATTVISSHRERALETWLAEAKACGIGAVETFGAGLEADSAVVRAALTKAWSSGQAEGRINRLKLLKRQSYRRAGFDLLRRRVLMAA